jgi:RimJ/RimL family protein N-acetyltransferase
MLSNHPLSAPIPVLHTERLILRAHCLADLPQFTAMFQLPAFFTFLGGKPVPEEEVWTKVLRNTGQWAILGLGYWAVEEKATGRFIGAVGFADWQRAMEPSIKGEPEIGWLLDPHIHGQGYATEAVQAALLWGTVHFTGCRTVCIIDPENTPSLRVAAKCGYQVVQKTIYKEKPILLLARPQ